METTIGARIRQLREAKQLSVAEFAKAAGIKPSAVYGLESDANKPSLETVATLRQSFPGLNTEWLQFGEGEMFSRVLSQLPPPVPSKLEEPKPAGYPPVPGTATPQEADFVGRLIHRLETELAGAKAREEAQQRMIETLLGKSPASAHAATPEARTEISLRPTACLQVAEAKMLEMYPAQPAKQEEELVA